CASVRRQLDFDYW
nr:immunoglobulin heavy chain junction region [Macaca mulatta]